MTKHSSQVVNQNRLRQKWMAYILIKDISQRYKARYLARSTRNLFTGTETEEKSEGKKVEWTNKKKEDNKEEMEGNKETAETKNKNNCDEDLKIREEIKNEAVKEIDDHVHICGRSKY